MKPATDPARSAPEVFGPYELHERLGMGGMATVYRAKKRGPDGYERNVALKRMLSHLAEDASFVDSFIREAKVASMFAHPNIAQVYDFGRIGGTYYIAMELVAGSDLRRLLRHANRNAEAIPMPVVFSLLAELCDALEYAHSFVDEHGSAMHIVHRDISPSNLIVAPTGHVKVIDFGIAKASSRQLHTESGLAKGKLGYMAPEVALGMTVGPAADVFSMGVVAWEVITALPLFTGRTDFETMSKLREASIPPPSFHNQTCPPELDALVLHAVERDHERRLPAAAAFRRALDHIAARYGIPISVRAVADWIQQFPTDGPVRHSHPTESPTAMLRPSRANSLRRSNADVQLATEIWGEDAQTGAAPPIGPDFSSANPAITLPLAPPPASVIHTAYQPPISASYAPPPAPRRPWLAVLAVLGAIASGLGAYLIWSTVTALPAATRSATLVVTPIVPDALITARDADHSVVSAAPAPVPVVASLSIDAAVQPEPTRPGRPTHKHPAIAAHDPPPPPPPPPHHDDPVVTPPKPVDLPPPKPDPVAVPAPLPPKPEKPARVPLVGANTVAKLSGELPTLRGDSDGDVLAKICIDDTGHVTSVKIVKSPPDIADTIQHALETWRYKPYLNHDNAPSPVCFPFSLRAVVKRPD